MLFPYTYLNEQREEPIDPKDERYDLTYIAREADLLVQWLNALIRRKDKNHNVFNNQRSKQLSDQDNRILQRWGIR